VTDWTSTPAERNIAESERALQEVYGADAVGKALPADLDDLAFTLDKATSLRERLPREKDEWDQALYSLEQSLTSEIPMIAEDVVPCLKRLRGSS
jgi:hypothetical protein